jgi:tetratricopeptide (TPR) repeat protein
VLLLLEDLHWADEGTLSLLNRLARSISGMRVMIVGTYRDTDLGAGSLLVKTLDELIRLRVVERIELSCLPHNAVAEMIEALSGREPPQPIVTLFCSYTEGNPFFVEELFRHLAERGELTTPDGEFRSARDLVGNVDVPHSLRLVIGRRLLRLSDETQKAIATAAVIGRSFTIELLEASTRVDADQLLDYVEEAERAGLITSKLQYPQARFAFAHELIRRAVLDQISAARRQRLHLSIADAIERTYPDALEDRAEDLAHHLWQAGSLADPARAVRYLTMAGQAAVQRSASMEAVGYFKNALELLNSIPQSPERLRQELLLLSALGTALLSVRGFATREVEGVYARARALSQQTGEARQLFRILWGQWLNYIARGDCPTALELVDQCMQLAQSTGDSGLILEAHQAAGVTNDIAGEGEFRKSLGHFEQAIAIYDLEQHGSHAYTYGQDPGAMCLIHSGRELWFLGYPDQARKRTNDGIALARKLSHPGTLAIVMAFGAWLQLLCRNAQAVEELAAEAVAIASERDYAFFKAMGTVFGDWALAQSGQKASGIERMRLGIEAFRATGGVTMLPMFSALLAEAYGEAERVQDGLSVLAGITTRDPYWEAELHRVRGELVLKNLDAGTRHLNDERAEACFRQALDVARRQEAKSLELRAAMSLFRLRVRHGRRAEARPALEEIFRWFTEGFDTPDLCDARRLLELP